MGIRMMALLPPLLHGNTEIQRLGPTSVPGFQVPAVSRACILCYSSKDIYQLLARKLLFLLAMGFGLIEGSKAILDVGQHTLSSSTPRNS